MRTVDPEELEELNEFFNEYDPETFESDPTGKAEQEQVVKG